MVDGIIELRIDPLSVKLLSQMSLTGLAVNEYSQAILTSGLVVNPESEPRATVVPLATGLYEPALVFVLVLSWSCPKPTDKNNVEILPIGKTYDKDQLEAWVKEFNTYFLSRKSCSAA